MNKVLEDIHSARSKCFRPKGAPAPEPNWEQLKKVDEFVDEQYFHNEANFAPSHHDKSVKLAILKDKIYFEFGLEDEDIFYMIDKLRQKKNY